MLCVEIFFVNKLKLKHLSVREGIKNMYSWNKNQELVIRFDKISIRIHSVDLACGGDLFLSSS